MSEPTEVPGWVRLTQVARSDGAAYRACERFMAAVDRRDAAAVWGMLDGAYRLFWVQGIVAASPAGLSGQRERDRLVSSVVRSGPTNPLWPDLEQALEQWFDESFGWLRGRELGCSTAPSPLGPDVEIVAVGPLDTLDDLRRPQTAVAMVMRVMPDRSWLVAGIDYLPIPGWPPRVEPLPG